MIFFRCFLISAVLIMPLISCSGKTVLESSVLFFPADGTSGGVVSCRSSGSGLKIEGPGGDAEAVFVTARERQGNTEKVFFKSTGLPGKVYFFTKDGAKLKLTFYKSASDIDGDGFPDEAELVTEADRAAFTGWFIRIAESQFLKRNISWNDKERDCAGLIRYAYREALKIHDEEWLKRSGVIVDKNLPDVKRFNYPDVPVLKDRIFKTGKGDAADISSFGAFADAGTLLSNNVSFVSRKLSDARAGDLLFFHIESVESPYHSMIITETRGEMMLVYHTGRGDVVKRVPLSYLDKSGPFEPVEANKRFMGVYRFKILE